ncbi:cytochrome P450 [uncultured Aeromicrobium sp.]|uniref:cytochrome P450 n=1 Tax=uncultured Aeromicrobium sp. TaxID=337820 RepID=UPI0025D84790|nr:cytochrome P450 [uncultured Aeromicrobium sp.]
MRDHSLSLVRRGYDFTRWLRDDDPGPVITRLMGRPAAVIEGVEAARFFYTEPTLSRKGAAPPIPAMTLFGPGAVHSTDDEEHRHRKAQFVDLLNASAALEVSRRAGLEWDRRVAELGHVPDVFSMACEVLFTAVRDWAGVSTEAIDVRRGTAQMVAMIDGFGSAGRRQLRAVRGRLAAQRWAGAEIKRARTSGESRTPLAAVAQWTGSDGRPLPLSVAAVELLNLLRPTVAVAWFVAAVAESFVTWPDYRFAVKVRSVDPKAYAHEVRRYYPFVPLLAAKTRTTTSFEGHEMPPGGRFVLDIWQHLNDPRIWGDPENFRPERFTGRAIGTYDLIPQGGGDKNIGHRCPGEDVAIELIEVFAIRLAEFDAIEGHGPSMRGNHARMPPRPYRARLTR